MTDISSQALAEQLLSDGYSHTSPVAVALSDPIADTHMIVTLDELQPYEFNPRLTRNPRYDEIKDSIRERGLDAPPSITRRPGDAHYIIRNGGNTRLAILRELWMETHEERFWRIGCLFRPWPERGEIIALTGHLAENELHGVLSFVERALGVEKVRQLYEQDLGKPLSQSELARRLKSDGYPVPQPHISRMQEAVQYLLPAIPRLLYGGLGRHQVEQLTGLRRAGARIWQERSSTVQKAEDFTSLFQTVLEEFDKAQETFSVMRVLDELTGRMADLLGLEYDTLAVLLMEAQSRWQLLTGEPAPQVVGPPELTSIPASLPIGAASRVYPKDAAGADTTERTTTVSDEATGSPPTANETTEPPHVALVDAHVISPIETSDRLHSIQRLVAQHLGEAPAMFEDNVVHAVPVQAGGLYPISDVWYIEPALNDPDRLRLHIAQFAREIAAEAGQADAVLTREDGLGFCCDLSATLENTSSAKPAFARAAISLLNALSAPYQPAPTATAPHPTNEWTDQLALLLQGGDALFSPPQGSPARISDAGLVKLFRLLRLARRLFELQTGRTAPDGNDATPGP